MRVALVPAEQVEDIRPVVLPFVEMAAEYTYGRYTPEDIFTAIADYEHTLWVAYDDNAVIKGIVVTALKQYPRMRALDLVFLGGDNGFSWKDEMLRVLQCWAFDNHCDVVESSGRFGWAQVFKADGYKPLWQVYELPVGNNGIGG